MSPANKEKILEMYYGPSGIGYTVGLYLFIVVH